MSEASAVSETARRETVRASLGGWDWVDTTVWTERMLAALDNGVTGGKWYSLMDKVYRRRVLEASWQPVRRNRGAAGADRVSVERCAGHAEHYLEELSEALRTGTYRPQAVRRVEIPKGDGGVRPLGIPTVKDRVV
jgi:RNA-directed DNA polymerase